MKTVANTGYHKWRKMHHCAEIGYDLAPAGWGQGYMTEALRAVLQYGFGPMALNRVQAPIHADNYASLRLAERLGSARKACSGSACARRACSTTTGCWRA